MALAPEPQNFKSRPGFNATKFDLHLEIETIKLLHLIFSAF